MSTLIIGDVHGCVDELEQLLTLAAADRVVLVGDLFTKGPDPAGVWALIRSNRLPSVLGNHDQRLLDHLDGLRPGDRGARRCVAALDASDPGWRRYVREMPLFIEIAGVTVVHAALHPSGSLQDTPRHTATVLRRWPDDAPDDPRWWSIYHGERRVVFGHDARVGLVRVERGGVPWVIGLDTGCVYGGALTGWLIEDDRLVHVPAARPYSPIR